MSNLSSERCNRSFKSNENVLNISQTINNMQLTKQEYKKYKQLLFPQNNNQKKEKTQENESMQSICSDNSQQRKKQKQNEFAGQIVTHQKLANKQTERKEQQYFNNREEMPLKSIENMPTKKFSPILQEDKKLKIIESGSNASNQNKENQFQLANSFADLRIFTMETLNSQPNQQSLTPISNCTQTTFFDWFLKENNLSEDSFMSEQQQQQQQQQQQHQQQQQQQQLQLQGQQSNQPLSQEDLQFQQLCNQRQELEQSLRELEDKKLGLFKQVQKKEEKKNNFEQLWDEVEWEKSRLNFVGFQQQLEEAKNQLIWQKLQQEEILKKIKKEKTQKQQKLQQIQQKPKPCVITQIKENYKPPQIANFSDSLERYKLPQQQKKSFLSSDNSTIINHNDLNFFRSDISSVNVFDLPINNNNNYLVGEKNVINQKIFEKSSNQLFEIKEEAEELNNSQN